VDVPATWWQHFKRTYRGRRWLRWLVRRHPVVYRTHNRTCQLTVNVQRFYTYPHAPILPESYGRPYRVATVNPTLKWGPWNDE